VEKALLDQLPLHYLHAHQIAVRAERDAVRAAGISWQAYQSFMKKHEKPIEEEKLIRVPRDLDLTPYRDEKDFGLLQRRPVCCGSCEGGLPAPNPDRTHPLGKVSGKGSRSVAALLYLHHVSCRLPVKETR
jgi:hypothetical protein